MDLRASFQETADIVAAIIPVDLQTAANDGDWVNIRDIKKLLVVFFGAIGTAGQDPVFTLRQATSAAGAGEKALPFTRILSKVGATALSAVGQWTITNQTAANTYTDAVSAENEKLIVVEVTPDMLDVNNGFTWVQLQIPDVGGNAQLGCGLYVALGRAYVRENPASLIA